MVTHQTSDRHHSHQKSHGQQWDFLWLAANQKLPMMVLISNCLTIILKNYLGVLEVPIIWLPTETSHTQRYNSPLSVCPNFQFKVWVDSEDFHNQESCINPTVVLYSPGARAHSHLQCCLFYSTKPLQPSPSSGPASHFSLGRLAGRGIQPELPKMK